MWPRTPVLGSQDLNRRKPKLADQTHLSTNTHSGNRGIFLLFLFSINVCESREVLFFLGVCYNVMFDLV